MHLIDLGVLAGTFVLILPAELPDKTFVASLVLATRFPRLPVWTGVTAAFAIQCLIAVAAAWLLTLLPERVLSLAAAVLFGIGAAVMLRGGLLARGDWRLEMAAEIEEERTQEKADAVADRAAGPVRAAATSFGLIFLAEWGDLSQLLTAGLAARSGEPVSVFLGAWLALAVVAGIAVLAGAWLARRVPLHRIRLVAAALLTVLAALALWDTVRG
jgi:putative Ca2+/H+ antiporter (TMEM165/GDT1 family)